MENTKKGFLEIFCPDIKYKIEKELNKEETYNLVVSLGRKFDELNNHFIYELKPKLVLKVVMIPNLKYFNYVKGEKTTISKNVIPFAGLFQYENILYLVGADLTSKPPFLLDAEFLALNNKLWKSLALFLKNKFNIEKCIGLGFINQDDASTEFIGFPMSKCETYLEKNKISIPEHLTGIDGIHSLVYEMGKLDIPSFVLLAGLDEKNIFAVPDSLKKMSKKLEEILNVDLKSSKFENMIDKAKEDISTMNNLFKKDDNEKDGFLEYIT